jgi:hypothetical protein
MLFSLIFPSIGAMGTTIKDVSFCRDHAEEKMRKKRPILLPIGGRAWKNFYFGPGKEWVGFYCEGAKDMGVTSFK